MSCSIKNSKSLCGHDTTQFVEVDDKQHNTFPCGACRTAIVGKRFTCKSCGFNLHRFCKTRPASLSLTTLHPQHPVAVQSTPSGAPPERKCDVCQDPIEGTFYSCHVGKQCDFDVHPVCSQVPTRVPHVLDPNHSLQLQHQPHGKRYCDVCRGECGGWAYRCGECSVDVHFGCLLTPTAKAAAPAATTTTTRSIIQTGQGQGQPHPYGMGCGLQTQQQPFYFGSCHYPPYMHMGAALVQPYGWPHPAGAGYNYPYGNGTVNAGSQSGGGSSTSHTGAFFGSLGLNVLANVIASMIHVSFF